MTLSEETFIKGIISKDKTKVGLHSIKLQTQNQVLVYVNKFQATEKCPSSKKTMQNCCITSMEMSDREDFLYEKGDAIDATPLM